MTLNEKNIEVFKLFDEKFKKLKNGTFIRYIKRNGLHFSYSFEKEKFNNTHKHPTENAIDTFVLNIRLFIQDNDKISIRKLVPIYEKCPYSNLKDMFYKNRKMLNDYLGSKFPFKINKKNITLRQIFNGFIYSQIAHTSKREHFDFLAVYEGVHKVAQGMLKHQFFMTCLNVYRIIERINNINQEWIKKS